MGAPGVAYTAATFDGQDDRIAIGGRHCEQVAIGAVCPECGRENTDIRPAPDTLPPHLPTTAGAAVRGPSGGSGEEVRA